MCGYPLTAAGPDFLKLLLLCENKNQKPQPYWTASGVQLRPCFFHVILRNYAPDLASLYITQ
jgi:hypothetical protein